MATMFRVCFLLFTAIVFQPVEIAASADEDTTSLPKATIDGTGLGWRKLGEADFVPVNGAKDTWSWKDGMVHCTGKPHGVSRTQKQYTNFELVAQWQHLPSG